MWDWLILFLFSLFTGVQIVWIMYSLLFQFRFKSTNHGKQYAASVIVAAHNEYENLKLLIPAILNQNKRDFELIVALDRSDDGSLAYLQRFSDNRLRVVEINKVPENIHPKKYALQEAAKLVNNPIIVLTDADCLPASNNWLERMSTFRKDETICKIGIGQYEKKEGFLSNLIQLETIQTALWYTTAAFFKSPYMVVGRNVAYKTSYYQAVIGNILYESKVGGDDDLVFQQMQVKDNVELILSFDSQTISKEERAFSDWLQQKRRHLGVADFYDFKSKVIAGSYQISHTLMYVFLVLSLFFDELVPYSVSLFVFRTIIFTLSIELFAKKYNFGINWRTALVIEGLLSIILNSTKLTTYWNRTIKWR